MNSYLSKFKDTIPSKLGAVLLCTCLSIAHYSAGAATPVCGTIINQTWTKANSPYVITCDILVAGLTVREGVTVQFQGNYAFEVQGVLQCQGTESEPVVFNGTNVGWQGIFFNISSPGSELRYCVISNSVNSGVRIVDSI